MDFNVLYPTDRWSHCINIWTMDEIIDNPGVRSLSISFRSALTIYSDRNCDVSDRTVRLLLH